MIHADLLDLRNRIEILARESLIGERVEDVRVEPNEPTDGGDFLRVIVQIRDPDEVRVEQAAPLVRAIEDLVAQFDERFPSVRFSEAA